MPVVERLSSGRFSAAGLACPSALVAARTDSRKIVDKSGAWFSYGGERIGQGREASKEYLKAHPEMAREIETKIRESVRAAIKAEGHARPAAAVEKRPDDKRSPTGKAVS